MRQIARIILVLSVLCVCLLADQTTKRMARQELAASPGTAVLHGVIGLKYAENTGAFQSLGANMSETVKFWLFTVLVAMLLLALLIHLLTRAQIGNFSLCCSALILGGGLSNLLDRLQYDGAVIDFLFLSLAGLRSAIFNLADLCISTGLVGLLLWHGWRLLRAKTGHARD